MQTYKLKPWCRTTCKIMSNVFFVLTFLAAITMFACGGDGGKTSHGNVTAVLICFAVAVICGLVAWGFSTLSVHVWGRDDRPEFIYERCSEDCKGA